MTRLALCKTPLLLLTFFLLLSFTTHRTAYAQPSAFLVSPYYGSIGSSGIF